jgi:hypothetical protein
MSRPGLHGLLACQTIGLMTDDLAALPLFNGPHIPRIRFERALRELDIRGAIADAPEELRGAVVELAAALPREGEGVLADLDRLVRCHHDGWPELLEQTWNRLVGRHLDGRGIPGVLNGEPAAVYLLRGGEYQRARESIQRHLSRHPRDVKGWAVFAHFAPVLGAARCAFHGGPVLEVASRVSEEVLEDEGAPVGPWLLSYGWFSGHVALEDIAQALEVEGLLSAPPLPLPGDPRAFAWCLLDAGGRPLGHGSVGVVEARRRLQRISLAAFRRYLARAAER